MFEWGLGIGPNPHIFYLLLTKTYIKHKLMNKYIYLILNGFK